LLASHYTLIGCGRSSVAERGEGATPYPSAQQSSTDRVAMTPLYLLKIVFPKFDPLAVAGMALCVDIGWTKMSTLILLSLRRSGMELSLVSD
jgi:hypothetical protein